MTLPVIVLLPILMTCGFLEPAGGNRLKNLKNVPVGQIPTNLQRIVRNSDLTGQEGYCCAVNNTKTVNVSTSKLEQYTQSYRESYHEDCGFLFWSSCTHYRTGYRTATRYVTKYFDQLRPTVCPDEHIVCCSDYTMVSGKCILTSLLAGIKNPDNTNK